MRCTHESSAGQRRVVRGSRKIADPSRRKRQSRIDTCNRGQSSRFSSVAILSSRSSPPLCDRCCCCCSSPCGCVWCTCCPCPSAEKQMPAAAVASIVSCVSRASATPRAARRRYSAVMYTGWYGASFGSSPSPSSPTWEAAAALELMWALVLRVCTASGAAASESRSSSESSSNARYSLISRRVARMSVCGPSAPKRGSARQPAIEMRRGDWRGFKNKFE